MRTKWIRAVALISAMTASMVGLATAPAAAAPAGAYERCRDGWPSNHQYETRIAGTTSSVTVGGTSDFWPGDYFRITASGTIRTSGLIWDNYTPDGRWGDPAPYGDYAWPGWGLRKFSLVGAFGTDRANMQFGTSVFCVPVPTSRPMTYLRMWINDNVTVDNSGEWVIWVDHYYV